MKHSVKQNEGVRAPLPATRRFAALCLAALALCLALPFAVFALWDRALLHTPHPLPADPEALGVAGRANPTACLLYATAHTTNVSLDGVNIYDLESGWNLAADTALPALREEAAALLPAMETAGLLDAETAEAAAAALGPDAARYTWRGGSAPGGLTMLTGYPAETEQAGVSLSLIWTPEGAPVYVRLYVPGTPLRDPVREGALEAYLTLTGLDDFADWQVIDLSASIPDAGEAAYSAEAQLYVTANARDGLSLSAASVPPKTMAEMLEMMGVAG